MTVEACHYRLSLHGKPVGNHTLSTGYRGRTALLSSKMMLQSRFQNATVTQHSKVHRDQFFSFAFEEKTVAASETRNFKLEFDLEEGLVRAKRGNETATTPYIQAFEDPLGLLYHIRNMGEESTLRVPMLGKDVVVERIGDMRLETALGEKQARVYVLQPGGSHVYIDSEAPHPILMLRQRFDGQHLDALIVRIDEEVDEPRKASKRRRRRRRERK